MEAGQGDDCIVPDVRITKRYGIKIRVLVFNLPRLWTLAIMREGNICLIELRKLSNSRHAKWLVGLQQRA